MSTDRPRIVFLYTELAGYIRSCMEHLASHGAEVHVMAYPINAEAPFDFETTESAATYYRRNDYNRAQLEAWLDDIAPQLIICSGWIDADYVSLCRTRQKGVQRVLALDNPYPVTFKGKAALLRARLRYKPAFDHAWVPGEPQLKYAAAMGFERKHIHTGFYTADVAPMEQVRALRKSGQFIRRFIYVGRYIDFKGVEDLWKAFAQLDRPGWELHCAGVGPLYDARPNIPGLHHAGFVQPADLDTFVAEGGVFVLPSHREPWGVVVHEMAAAGLPLICSSAVGAATAFLKQGVNGIVVAPRDVDALRKAMQQMADKPLDELEEMGRQSAALAAALNKEVWTQTATCLINNKD